MRATPVTNYARYQTEEAPPSSSHKNRFHRHHKEKEYRDKDLPARPPPTPKDSSASIATFHSYRDGGANASTAALITGRSGSPTPSIGSAYSIGGGPKSPTNGMAPHSKKRHLLGFVRSKDKDRGRNGSGESIKSKKHQISAPLQTSPNLGTMVRSQRGQQNSAGSAEHLYSFPFNKNRKNSDNPSLRLGGLYKMRKDSDQSGLSGRGDGTFDMPGSYFPLDTNMQDMQGIVKPISQAAQPTGNEEGWLAPDSWNVTTKERKEREQRESKMDEMDDDKPIWSVMVSCLSDLVVK